MQHDRDVAEVQVEVDEADLASPAVGEGRGEIACQRGFSAAALGREDRHDDAAATVFTLAVRGALTHRRGDVANPPDRVVDTREVAFFDDFANAVAQCVDEQRGVDAAPHQHHAEARAGDPHAVAEVERGVLVDRRAEHDGVLARMRLEVAAEVIECLEHQDAGPEC